VSLVERLVGIHRKHLAPVAHELYRVPRERIQEYRAELQELLESPALASDP
jgi:hypothetical protein